jgi:hypothetical protein
LAGPINYILSGLNVSMDGRACPAALNPSATDQLASQLPVAETSEDTANREQAEATVDLYSGDYVKVVPGIWGMGAGWDKWRSPGNRSMVYFDHPANQVERPLDPQWYPGCCIRFRRTEISPVTR